MPTPTANPVKLIEFPALESSLQSWDAIETCR